MLSVDTSIFSIIILNQLSSCIILLLLFVGIWSGRYPGRWFLSLIGSLLLASISIKDVIFFTLLFGLLRLKDFWLYLNLVGCRRKIVRLECFISLTLISIFAYRNSKTCIYCLAHQSIFVLLDFFLRNHDVNFKSNDSTLVELALEINLSCKRADKALRITQSYSNSWITQSLGFLNISRISKGNEQVLLDVWRNSNSRILNNRQHLACLLLIANIYCHSTICFVKLNSILEQVV